MKGRDFYSVCVWECVCLPHRQSYICGAQKKKGGRGLCQVSFCRSGIQDNKASQCKRLPSVRGVVTCTVKQLLTKFIYPFPCLIVFWSCNFSWWFLPENFMQQQKQLLYQNIWSVCSALTNTTTSHGYPVQSSLNPWQNKNKIMLLHFQFLLL